MRNERSQPPAAGAGLVSGAGEGLDAEPSWPAPVGPFSGTADFKKLNRPAKEPSAKSLKSVFATELRLMLYRGTSVSALQATASHGADGNVMPRLSTFRDSNRLGVRDLRQWDLPQPKVDG